MFEEMQQANLRADVITYSTLISACEKDKHTDTAFDVFQNMKAAGVAPNVVTYSAMVSVCAQAGRAEDAMGLFREMREVGVVPNAVTYTALISACEKGRKFEWAFEAFDGMKKAGVAPNLFTFSALISVCEKVLSSPPVVSLPLLCCYCRCYYCRCCCRCRCRCLAFVRTACFDDVLLASTTRTHTPPCPILSFSVPFLSFPLLHFTLLYFPSSFRTVYGSRPCDSAVWRHESVEYFPRRDRVQCSHIGLRKGKQSLRSEPIFRRNEIVWREA